MISAQEESCSTSVDKGIEQRQRQSPEKSSNTGTPQCVQDASTDNDRVTKSVFNYFDENGDGKISPAELQSCMRVTGGGQLSRQEAEMAVQLSDTDDDGLLDIDEFRKLMKGSGLSEAEREGELREAFGMYAAAETGCITTNSLKRMLSQLGKSSTTSNCEAMIRKFDLNGDGVLNFDEFSNMMKH